MLSMYGKYTKANPSEWVPCGFRTQEIVETDHFGCMRPTMKILDHDFAYHFTYI